MLDAGTVDIVRLYGASVLPLTQYRPWHDSNMQASPTLFASVLHNYAKQIVSPNFFAPHYHLILLAWGLYIQTNYCLLSFKSIFVDKICIIVSHGNISYIHDPLLRWGHIAQSTASLSTPSQMRLTDAFPPRHIRYLRGNMFFSYETRSVIAQPVLPRSI